MLSVTNKRRIREKGKVYDMKYAIFFVAAFLSLEAHSQSMKNTKKENHWYTEHSFGSFEELLDNAKDSAEAISGLHSLLVYKSGELVMEEYLHGYVGKRPEHVRSITKSIMSLLVGIAVDKGIIPTVNESIATYFNELTGSDKEAITIEDLLTMSSGLKWSESNGNSEFNAWRGSENHIDYVLDKELVTTPGNEFNYNSGALHLLSVILTKASRMTTLEFARMHLFDPLEISEVRWEFISGYYNGSAGVELLPADLLKIGQLMLYKGIYGGKQVIAEPWQERSVKSHYTLFDNGSEHEGYGYAWWTVEYKGERFYGARGYGGQHVAVFPSLELIVITTAQWTGLRGRAAEQTKEIYELIVGDIALPIFQNDF